jgi:hypothetical protein
MQAFGNVYGSFDQMAVGTGALAQPISQMSVFNAEGRFDGRFIDINARDGFRRTVLYYAGVFNSSDVMQFLISQGADVHVKFGTGGTVLGNCCDPLDLHGKEDLEKKRRFVQEAMES